ncbi:2-C-methyl-D-erythritol 4-phosphate cytidylyltransferase [Raineyella antarctica]|uniref:2-C-methyl-D-erythritol 4-phosphate cytidylyltransferase n=1 Tax=Raineyella antarctica TaxID=1577474 RepID=A0A1G6GE39_9ACTN|nr:2-C-methyl-D-erythritol 4-phosphate cytidylyltransferase [Raineyella antarctica]SDB80282.1 2-C-methyl-D-erythritol 4-phosphate cytidylyltransferase [Raineyella antarctica]
MTSSASPEPVVAVVVAAGSGVRLGAGAPKALREIGGRALVAHAVNALAAGGVTRVVVVSRLELADDFDRALADATIPWTLVGGGAERQDSVANGLAEVARVEPGARHVLVHDAARPFVPATVVAAVVDALRAGAPAVIPVTPVVDTIRALSGGPGASAVVDRSVLRAVQTPQGFDLATLVRAHQHVRSEGLAVTDDAMACEAIGAAVTLVEGSRDALKVTDPFDLEIAEAVWQRRRHLTGETR